MICIRCHRKLSTNNFRWRNQSKNQKNSTCRKCDSKIRSAKYAEDPSKVKARYKKWLLNRKEKDLNNERLCIACLKTLPSRFFRWKNRKAGLKVPRCKPCDILYRAEVYRSKTPLYIERNKRRYQKLMDFVTNLKRGPCMDCKKKFDPCAMDFDHRDSSLKIDKVSRLLSRSFSKERILEEINKCDLICANCHRVRTKLRFDANGEKHGTRKPRAR